MPVKYKFVEKVKPGSKESIKDVQAPVTVYTETIDPDRFLKKLHEQSHMSRADIIRCLFSLRKLLTEELKDGNIVQTGIIGTFSPLVKKSKNEKDKGTLGISINYRPDLEMKKELRLADLKKVRGNTTG